jgi:hypothetical protein
LINNFFHSTSFKNTDFQWKKNDLDDPNWNDSFVYSFIETLQRCDGSYHAEIGIPEILLRCVQKKSTKKKISSFETRLGLLLEYVEINQEKYEEDGCKWIGKVKFIARKSQLMKIFNYKEMNGINHALRGFHPISIKQSSKQNKCCEYWKEGFLIGKYADLLNQVLAS